MKLILVGLSLFLLLFNGVQAQANLVTLEKQAKNFQQQILNRNNKNKVVITAQTNQKLTKTAYFFYNNKECKLAANIQKKRLGYKLENKKNNQQKTSAFDWYRLSLYSACSYDQRTASKSIFLAWKLEKNNRQKYRYQVMLADYLFSIYQLKNTWNASLIDLYQQLSLAQLKDNSSKQKIEFKQKIEQLKQIASQNSQLIFSQTKAISEQGQLKICMQVNLSGYWDNQQNRAIKLEDYIRTKPKFEPIFERNYNELCLLGAKWSTEYQIDLLKGLTIESKHLPQNHSLKIKTIARPEDFWFKSSRYILSNSGKNQVPIYAVNTAKIHVALYQILPENLQSKVFLRLFTKNISNYDLKRISEQLGNKVWSSDVILDQKTPSNDLQNAISSVNKTQLKQIPLPDKYTKKSGVYILIAAKNKQQLDTKDGYANLSAQWLFMSDIGLTSYKSSDGITLLAHSLATGKSLLDLNLSLYSKNNSLLAKEITDIKGQAVFSANATQGKNGLVAMQVIASHPEYGFLFYPLESAGFDLSDRGVSGRISLASIEAYLYTERGIYRPGENVNLVTLLRDDNAAAIEGLPLTLKVINPDGLVVREQLLKGQGAGGYSFSFKLPMAIRTGSWQFEIYADLSAAALGQVSFLIEEIKPPRLQAHLSADESAVEIDKNKPFSLQADYLFGAPAAKLKVNAFLSLNKMRSPFLDYSDYIFGSDEKETSGQIYYKQLMTEGNQANLLTDSKGNLIIDVALPDSLQTKQPLSGLLRVEVLDHDGMMIPVQKYFKVLNLPAYIGIGKSFQQSAPVDTTFSLKIISLDKNAKMSRVNNLSWRLIKEESYYQWFNKQGDWSYEKIVQELLQQEGQIVDRKSDIELLNFELAQGEYRLEVLDTNTEISSSFSFVVGEQVKSINDLPDVVKLSLDKAAYQFDDEIELNIESPYTGEVDIVLADNKIHSILKLHLTDKNTKIKIPVSKNWGVGTYALVSVYTGNSASTGREKDKHLSKRAMGVIWINRDKKPYLLDVKIATPEKIKPMQQLNVPISVNGFNSLAQVHVTLAAVDQGVLNLTKYQPPQPVAYFLAKRQLETQINDNYAHLIDNLNGKPAQLRDGGGAMAMAMVASDNSRASTPAKNINIVSLFSGIVQLDNTGKANINLDIPDFNGQLKLMAVAWNKNKIGSVQKQLYVNDDVVLQTSIPRFLSLNDKADISLLVHNLHGVAGDYRLELIRNDSLADKLPKLEMIQDFHLDEGESVTKSFPILARQLGNAKFQIQLTGPNQYQLLKKYNVGIRGVGLPTYKQSLKQLPGNSDWQISQQDMQAFEPNSVSKTLSLSTGINLGVYALLDKLDRYPHGCLEQLVSRATPLLSTPKLAKRWNYPIDPMTDSRINEAITLIIEKQRYDGSFALWSTTQGRSLGGQDDWLSMYAMEFLLAAVSQSYRVPDFYIQRGLKWISSYINNADYEQDEKLATLAYAHYILAKSGGSIAKSNIENMRYLAKQYAKKLPSLLSIAQLSHSLQLMGEDKLAKHLLDNTDVLNFKRVLTWQDYGSQLRDMAGFASLIPPQHKAYSQVILWLSQMLNFPESKNYRHYLSTQEQAWLIRLALTLGEDSPLQLSLDGKVVNTESSETTLNYNYQQLEQAKQLSNQSNVPIWINNTVYGQPKQISNYQKGFEITKTLYDEKGNQADLSNIKQGGRYIMLIQGKATTGLYQRAMVMDLLAAGLEIENANLNASFDISQLDWLPKLSSTRYIEALDDRFVAAIDIAKGKHQEFTIAYPVRAITKGSFNYPAVYIEDMYQPYFRANTKIGRMAISQ